MDSGVKKLRQHNFTVDHAADVTRLTLITVMYIAVVDLLLPAIIVSLF